MFVQKCYFGQGPLLFFVYLVDTIHMINVDQAFSMFACCKQSQTVGMCSQDDRVKAPSPLQTQTGLENEEYI